MTWEKFWSIIDRVRAQADMQDEASVNQFLYTELIKLPQDELLGFDCAWQSYRNKANFPKMVAAACIINDGSSDDRFTDFRNWLIMQGYDAYRQALIDPDNLAALNIPFRDTEWMGCGNVAWYAYAGQKLHTYFEKAGITAELHRKYPTLLKSSADLHQVIMQEQLAPCRAPETEWERQMLRTEVKHYIDTSGLAYSYNEFYEMGYRSPKANRLKEIAKAMNIREEIFLMPDETPIDLLRILIWYDWEHEGVLQLATSRTANTPPGKTVSPIIYSEQLPLNRLLLDWADKKHSLSVRKITRADYLEWMLQWPPRLP